MACEKSGMKKDNCCGNPRNDLTPVSFVGLGKQCFDSFGVWTYPVFSDNVPCKLQAFSDFEFLLGQCDVQFLTVVG